MKNLIVSAAFLFSLSAIAHADPVIIGDPSKGTVITSVKDGKSKVEITTTGIRVEDGDEDDAKDSAAAAGTTAPDAPDTPDAPKHHKSSKVVKGSFASTLEDIIVPGMFFLFLIAAILGGRYFQSRNDERRLELLKLMVEKGQQVPPETMQQLMAPQTAPEADTAKQAYKRTRNAYGFAIAGVLLIGHALVTHNWTSQAELVPGLIFLALGLGGLAGIYLPSKRNEEKPSA